MNKSIAQLEPRALWTYFDSLNAIPRGSKKEEKIIAFMVDFGKSLGLETLRDETGNVIIRKKATQGMENRKGVVLQSHLDMVLQKNSDVDFDFETQGIVSRIEGDWVTAEGTTLGADNGIGVAASMAVLAADDIPHGPLEALFTVDEETGMTGAFGLKGDVLNGDILLNLDSEDEGELYIGCAGGINTNITGEYKEEPIPPDFVPYELSVTGLKGGHSGMDINLERGNANKIITRILLEADSRLPLRLSSFEGGGLRNAIPREAKAKVLLARSHKGLFTSYLEEITSILRDEYADTEPDMYINARICDAPQTLVPEPLARNLLRAIDAAPNGVISMSTGIQGLVETSSNLAKVQIACGKTEILCLLRSSVNSRKDNLCRMIQSVFELVGGLQILHQGAYPGWKPDPGSEILRIMKKAYADLFGKTPEVKAVHAGLECGLLGSHYPAMEMISFGPTIRHPHSPDEKVHIPSVEKFWKYLLHTLKNIPGK